MLSHLQSGESFPGDQVAHLVKTLRVSNQAGLIDHDNYTGLAEHGHYLHHLYYAVSDNHAEAVAECMFGFLQDVPDRRTGVDRKTLRKDMLYIAESYGKARVEFGVLVGSHSGESDHGIFPPIYVVRAFKSLKQLYGMNIAIHLCGRYARMVMQDGGAPGEVYDLCNGFSRVQVNLHGDSFNPGRIAVSSQAIKRFADTVECQSVILQHRSDWQHIPVFHEKVEYLFDRSEGGGRAAFEEWPAPSPHLPRMGCRPAARSEPLCPASGAADDSLLQLAGLAGRSPNSTNTFVFSPSRSTLSVTLSPGLVLSAR